MTCHGAATEVVLLALCSRRLQLSGIHPSTNVTLGLALSSCSRTKNVAYNYNHDVKAHEVATTTHLYTCFGSSRYRTVTKYIIKVKLLISIFQKQSKHVTFINGF